MFLRGTTGGSLTAFYCLVTHSMTEAIIRHAFKAFSHRPINSLHPIVPACHTYITHQVSHQGKLVCHDDVVTIVDVDARREALSHVTLLAPFNSAIAW